MDIRCLFSRRCLLPLLLLTISAGAQNFELGKVSLAEVAERVHPRDSSAAAAVLFARGNTRFEYSSTKGFYTVTEVQVRLKIYKKSGLDWGSDAVIYYTGQDEDQAVAFSRAVTYNLVNGQIHKTKAKSENEFVEKANRNWSLRKIAMPEVREGSVIEYMFTITSPYISNLYDWDFQESIPVNYSEYKVSIPDFFKYSVHGKGFLNPQVESSSIRRDFSGVSNDMVNRRFGFRMERSNYTFDCVEVTTTYRMTNVPAMKDEVFVNNIENYTTSVSHELAAIKYPDEPEKNISKDWESVARKIYANPDFGLELDKRSYFENDLAPLKSHDPVETAARIYAFVQRRMSCNGSHSYSCSQGVRKAYQTQTGNIAEINLMLVAMLRDAGLRANPVLLSTRDNGIALFPNYTAFNYVIAAVEIGGQRILLDASDKKLVPGQLPLHALNWVGKMIPESGAVETINLMGGVVSKSTSTITASLGLGGEISGKMRTQHADYDAYLMRTRFFDRQKEAYITNLEQSYGSIAIEDFQTNGELELGKPVTETFSFSEYKGAEVIGERIYVSPLLFFSGSKNPFTQETRAYPIDFGYARQKKINATITLPAGYTVESLPAPAAITLEDKVCEFKYVVAQSGQQIQLNYSMNINQPIIAPETYEALKTFFRAIIEKEDEKIVLKKL